MKHYLLYTIPHNVLLLAVGLLLGVVPVYATSAKTDAPTCGDYDYTVTAVRGGTITAVFDTASCVWTITAVPGGDWTFLHWTDDPLAPNPRVIDFSSEVDLEEDEMSFTAIFAMEFTHCKTTGDYDYVRNDNVGGYISYELREDSILLTAFANTDYTFAQWWDGSYENPRVVLDASADNATFYATFIPAATKGLIDSWSMSGFVIKTTYSEGLLTDEGALTIYYGSDLMSSTLPDWIDYGVADVAVAYDAEYAGKTCHIVYKDASCEPVATLDVTIPVLVDGVSDVVVPNASTGVHVLEGGEATISGTQTLADLDIYAGGKAVIAGDVTASSVTMRADGPYFLPVPVPDLLVTGTLTNNNSNIINFDYALNFEFNYSFALPYTVNTINATYRSGNDASEHFVLRSYDGAARAAGGAGWTYYFDYAGYDANEDGDFDDEYDLAPTGHQNICAGKGYQIFSEGEYWDPLDEWSFQEMYGGIIRFPMTVDLHEHGETAAFVPVEQHNAAIKENKNWNLIGLPYLTSYQGAIGLYNSEEKPVLDEHGNPKKLRYITVPLDNFLDYQQEEAESALLLPFQAYFVQFADETAVKLAFQHPNTMARAPKRSILAAEKTQELKAGIELSHAGKSDHMGVVIGEQYTNDYDIDGDLTKWIGKSSRVKLYSLSGKKKLAYIAVPLAAGTGELTTVIPLGYDSAQVGEEMTFAVDTRRYPQLLSNENIEQLNLYDDVEGVTTNLLETSYTCTAVEKTDNTRFSLNVVYRAPQQTEVTTGCDEVRATSLPDGVYDLMGRRIDSDASRNAGVYIIIQNGKVRKEVVR